MSVFPLAQDAGPNLPQLTFYQPWASLIAIGAKRFETTVLAAPKHLLNRRVLLRASNNSSCIEIRGRLKERMRDVLEQAGYALETLPRGVVAGTALVEGCYKIKAVEDDMLELDEECVGNSNPKPRYLHLPYQERMFGCYQPGRWVWCFARSGIVLGWQSGTVKWFNETTGYGFIVRADGTDVFVHHTIVPDHACLNQGDAVDFLAAVSERGVMAIALRLRTDGSRC